MLLDASDLGSAPRPSPIMEPASFAGDATQALARYAAFGFHVEPALLTDEECGELLDASRRFGDDGHPTSPGQPTPSGGPLAPVMNPHRAAPEFLRALAHPAIVVIVERLVGKPISALQSQFFPCLPGTPGFTTHQDNHYVEAPADAFASAWIALDDVAEDNGALVVYPGSHDEPLLPVEELPDVAPQPTQAYNAIRQHVVVPEGYAPLTLEVSRGAVIFLHGHLLHGSHENRSRRPRPALLQTYVRCGSPFRRGSTAQRSEIDVYPASTRQRSSTASPELA